jgi:hypothetical protein
MKNEEEESVFLPTQVYNDVPNGMQAGSGTTVQQSATVNRRRVTICTRQPVSDVLASIFGSTKALSDAEIPKSNTIIHGLLPAIERSHDYHKKEKRKQTSIHSPF